MKLEKLPSESEELKKASSKNKLKSLIVGKLTKRYVDSDYHEHKNFLSCSQTFVTSSSALCDVKLF